MSQPRRLSALASALGVPYQGGDPLIAGVCSLSQPRPDAVALAQDPGAAQGVAAVIVDPAGAAGTRLPRLVSEQPRRTWLQAIELFYPARQFPPGVHPTAVVASSAQVAASAYIGPLCVIEEGAVLEEQVVLEAQCYVGPGARIGAGSRLRPQVRVLEAVVVGRRCLLSSGVVLGSSGFGHVEEQGRRRSIPHVGTVVLGDEVEVGANSCVDRATLDATNIGDRVKIDNLVQVAHNVHIEPDVVLCAQVGLSGSVTVGAGSLLGGKVGVADHVTIAPGTTLVAMAGVTKDLGPGVFGGIPAGPLPEQLRIHAALRSLVRRGRRP